MRLKFIFPLLLLLLSCGLVAQQSRIADKQFEMHAYQAALDAYSDNLDLASAPAKTLTRIGLCYFHTGRPQEAVEFLAMASGRKGFDPVHFLEWGRAAMMAGQYAEAQTAFESYRDVDHKTATLYLEAVAHARQAQPATGNIRIIREAASSSMTEWGLTFHAGKLLFNSYNDSLEAPPAGWMSGEQYHFLYASDRDLQGQLAAPRLFQKEVQFNHNDGPVVYSPNGKEVFFMRSQMPGNNRLTPEAGFRSSMFMADVNAHGRWENIRPFPYNGTAWSTAWPAISADGNTLFFSSDRPYGQGGMDIWRCQRRGDGWSEPVNLGPQVNTPGNEITPFPQGDGLWFASDRHPGKGGYDLFRALEVQGTYASVFPQDELNSPRDDLGLIVSEDGMQGYMLSNRHKRPDLDIYRVHWEQRYTYFSLVDALSQAPVAGALVDLQSCGGGSGRTDSQGLLMVQAPRAEACKFEITHPDYAVHTMDARLIGLNGDLQTVNLRPLAWQIPARVWEAPGGKPLADAQLRITDQRTGYFQDFRSDSEGRISVAMSPNTLFFINVSKGGYLSDSRTVQTGAQPDSNLLVPFELTAQAPVSAVTPVAADKPDMPEGPYYGVQVAAIAPQADADLGAYSALARFGTVYQRTGQDRTRVRVGLFTQRVEAERAAVEIQKAGYAGAYVVEEQPESLMDKVMVSMVRGKAEPATEEGFYLLRLAAYRNPKWFEPGDLLLYGREWEEVNGEWTVKFITAIPTIKAAREALAMAKRQGFPEAQLWMEKEGQRTRVE